jgi:hypothetical protein
MSKPVTIDVAVVRKLSDPADIGKLLMDALAMERTIETELDSLLHRASRVDEVLGSLQESTVEALQVAQVEADRLSKSTADNAVLAETVSKKVREMDVAQSRVRAALGRIELILDKSHAVTGVKTAFEKGDLEAAVGCVARYLEIADEDGPLSSPLGDASDQESNQAVVMEEWRVKVEMEVQRQTADAVHSREHQMVARLCRLFGPLQKSEEGVKILTDFLRTLIGERAQQDYDALVDGAAGLPAGISGNRADYVEALTNLFRDVATAIDEHLDLLKDAFGPDMTLKALDYLHSECDVRGSRLLHRFLDHRGLARVTGEIGMRRKDDSSAGSAPVEPRQVEGFLSELLALTSRGEEYLSYVLSCMAQAVSPSTLPPSKETSLRGGSLATMLRELLSYYISLEEYYVEESVAKAVRIDQGVAGSLTTSMVDDSFFILLSAGQRALTTGKAPSAVAVLNQLNTVLTTVYRTALSRKLQGAAGRLAAAAPRNGSKGSNVSSGVPSAISSSSEAAQALNNAEVSAEYVDKLRQQLEGLTSKVFLASHDRDRVKLVLADLSKTAADFRRLCLQSSDQLCNAIMGHLRPILDDFVETSYEIEAAGGALAPVSQWSHALVREFANYAAWLQPLLTPGMFESVAFATIDKIVMRMEATVSQKRFTQLGGLQLERDVRGLVVALSEVTTRSVRDRFARLQQLATVWGVESAEEANELMNDVAVGWRLNALDVRQALGQRVDLKSLSHYVS